MRLQPAALGVGEVLPSDVTALLPRWRWKRTARCHGGTEVNQLKAMLLAEKPSSQASTEAIMDLLDRFPPDTCGASSELRKSIELLHRLASLL